MWRRVLLFSLDCSTLPMIRTLQYWVLSKEVSSTIFPICDESTRDWTPVSRAIGEHSTHCDAHNYLKTHKSFLLHTYRQTDRHKHTQTQTQTHTHKHNTHTHTHTHTHIYIYIYTIKLGIVELPIDDIMHLQTRIYYKRRLLINILGTLIRPRFQWISAVKPFTTEPYMYTLNTHPTILSQIFQWISDHSKFQLISDHWKFRSSWFLRALLLV